LSCKQHDYCVGQLCRCMQHRSALMVPPNTTQDRQVLCCLWLGSDTTVSWCVWQLALSWIEAVSTVSLHGVGALLWHNGALLWNISSPHRLFTAFTAILTGPQSFVDCTVICAVIACKRKM
jgi:hypothetical protein